MKLIHENLEYDVAHQCWVTSYPWLVDTSTLPNNNHAALATLRKTEQTLSKDKQWVETYQRQMEDMPDRGVARKPSEEELQKWSGSLFYISHLAVVNPKSNSTPVSIVFNSSQLYKGTSLNSCLAKGPDCYMKKREEAKKLFKTPSWQDRCLRNFTDWLWKKSYFLAFSSNKVCTGMKAG